LLGLGSGFGLLTLAGKTNNSFIIIIVAIFAINASLIWWRFAIRWWSIMHLIFRRMSEIENLIGFKLNIIISKRDKDYMENISYLRQNGKIWEKIYYTLFYQLGDDIKPQKHSVNANYEYRKLFLFVIF
jgi:hypothetical protein